MRIKLRSPAELKHYEHNAKKHSNKQIDKIEASIRELGFNNPILIDQDDTIIAGHGRHMAAMNLGLNKVPTITLDHLTDEQKRAFILADNRLAEIGVEWDNELVQRELATLSDDLADLAGFKIEEVEVKDDKYTRKIEPPIYEITGELPHLSDLVNTTKTDALIEQIDESDLPDEIKDFLTHAAHRHTVFNFSLIAEYYAHAAPDVQLLMEESALIIIDFEKAIERGFVKLTKKFAKQFESEKRNAENLND